MEIKRYEVSADDIDRIKERGKVVWYRHNYEDEARTEEIVVEEHEKGVVIYVIRNMSGVVEIWSF